jgi:hypothetical protein
MNGYKWNHIIGRIKREFNPEPGQLVPILVKAADLQSQEKQWSIGDPKPVWPRTNNQAIGAYTSSDVKEKDDANRRDDFRGNWYNGQYIAVSGIGGRV